MNDQYRGNIKGTWPYYKGNGKAKCSVHAVTHDDSDYSWDTIESDTGWHPHTETHDYWRYYNDWSYGYQQ